jgi:diguanylate cyclase (GGDEF)-like protein
LLQDAGIAMGAVAARWALGLAALLITTLGVSANPAAEPLPLTDAEHQHLQTLAPLRVCVDPHYPPFEQLDRELPHEAERIACYGRPLSVVLLDLDLFKQINDQYRHPVGDQVLIGVANLISKHIRQTDRCGRWGGEEFLILCPETNANQVQQLGEKLRAALVTSQFGDAIAVSGSFGAATLNPGESVASLIQRGDHALYEAKHAGRNTLSVSLVAE